MRSLEESGSQRQTAGSGSRGQGQLGFAQNSFMWDDEKPLEMDAGNGCHKPCR